MKLPPKDAVCEALRAALERSLAMMVSAAQQTVQGVVHEDAKSEGDKDMRSTEQSYVARGQAMRAEDLAEQLQRFEVTKWRDYGDETPLGPGALVGVVVDGEEERMLFLVPYGGGTVLDVAGVTVTVVTPSSPVGAALVGKVVGDEFEQSARGKLREWSVEAVA